MTGVRSTDAGESHMKSGVSRSLIVLVSALALLLHGEPAVAQVAPNSARIEGRITDETGGALPGVAVTVKSPALQAPQLETVTDNDGRYRVPGLRGGSYTVTFALGGFQTVVREGLNLDAGFAATLDVR